MRYLDVILPVPIRKTFTYHLEDDNTVTNIGCRVIVTFGGQRFVTGIIKSINTHQQEDYQTHAIVAILDENPIVTHTQIKLWEWMANYYMCSLGEVMKAALPSGLKMESKSHALLNPNYEGDQALRGNEAKIYNFLNQTPAADFKQISKHIEVKNILPAIKRMVSKNIIEIEESSKEKYRPKMKAYFALSDTIKTDDDICKAFKEIQRARKQVQFLEQALLTFDKNKLIDKTNFLKRHGFTNTIYQQLLSKNIIKEHLQEVSRFSPATSEIQAPYPLSPEQTTAFNDIKNSFTKNKPCLIHGVTASGKTEVYIHLIKEHLEQGKQVLFLLPEISITIEMLQRLTTVFGNKVQLYHSRTSDAQRVELWHKTLKNTEGHLIIGARSSIFLPFKNLSLIIVDEEHEESYKQREPAPNYHARDTAVMLAHQTKANIILGSATPSIESAYNAQKGKYGLTHLMKRYSEVALPQITTINMEEAYKTNKRKHHFSFELIEAINSTLERQQQVILFQNRRGFSGFIECHSCGHVPHCKNCDISLTYHKFHNSLKCHYCGYSIPQLTECPECKSKELDTKGMGTEKILEQTQELFPLARIERFDQDTTRRKGAFESIISRFQERKTDILIGTQMIAKGLDFDNVGLVAIMNADNIMNFPDYRAHEKAYQLMSQVAGRAGRREKQGQVILQSYNPDYELITSVSQHDYSSFYTQQIEEREAFKYPPYVKLISITIKHRDWRIANNAAYHYANKLRERLGTNVLGPETPAISKVKLQHIRKIILKIDNRTTLQNTKDWLIELAETLKKHESYKATTVGFDVDF